MTGNETVDVILAIQGVIMTLCTLIGLLAPKGSMVGGIAAKIGADLKNQTVSVARTKKDLVAHIEKMIEDERS